VVRIAAGDERADPAHDILWLKGELRIRQTVAPAGFHRFSTATIDELLDETLELPAGSGGDTRTPSDSGELWLLGSADDGAAFLAPVTGAAARREIHALAATLG
jgi:hypothetical protein